MEKRSNKMPHNGSLLEKYVAQSGKRVTFLSKDMGYSAQMLMRLFDTPSIRTHVWWELGLLIDRNIFAELGERYPVKYKSKREEQLEAELEDVKRELEIYRRILDKR